jgi:ABC-type transport system involved in multi-copper enzyme maturation permease subunit
MIKTEPSIEKQELEREKQFPGHSSTPSLVLIKKTLIFDLCTIKRIIMSVVLLVLVPALVLAFTPPDRLSSDDHLLQLLGITTWYYTFSIMFPIIIIGATGPLISEELRTGTLLFLVSKPINRTRIVISKFIALYIFGILVSFLSLSIISLFAVIKNPFDDIYIYFGVFFLYSLVITLFYGGITMGFSSIFKRPRNVLLIPLALVIFSFLVIMMFKPLLFYGSNWYEKYLLYNFDLGYHFAHIFLWIGESAVPELLDYFGYFFMMFGIAETDDWITFEKTNYYPPIVSFLIVIIVSIIFIIAGALYLKKRDIS